MPYIISDFRQRRIFVLAFLRVTNQKPMLREHPEMPTQHYKSLSPAIGAGDNFLS